MRRMRVFLSSTFRDLAEARSRVSEGLRLAGGDVGQMEVFASRPEGPLEVCLQEVGRADLFLLLIGERYGTIEPESGLIWTANGRAVGGEMMRQIGVAAYPMDHLDTCLRANASTSPTDVTTRALDVLLGHLNKTSPLRLQLDGIGE